MECNLTSPIIGVQQIVRSKFAGSIGWITSRALCGAFTAPAPLRCSRAARANRTVPIWIEMLRLSNCHLCAIRFYLIVGCPQLLRYVHVVLGCGNI